MSITAAVGAYILVGFIIISALAMYFPIEDTDDAAGAVCCFIMWPICIVIVAAIGIGVVIKAYFAWIGSHPLRKKAKTKTIPNNKAAKQADISKHAYNKR